VDKQTDLISRLQDEADLCRNDGASDIAALLDEAVSALQAQSYIRAQVAPGVWAYVRRGPESEGFPFAGHGLTTCDMHDDESN